jgi:hypothetical protein
MGFLKGLGTTVCSILLFLALTVFSIAFLLNSTVLNSNFMNSQIDKLDISAIAHDAIDTQIKEELPSNSDFVSGVVLDFISKEEPLIKAQFHNAINEAYDYFLEKTDILAVTISLAQIKKDIQDNIWQTAVDYLTAKLKNMSSAEANSYVADIAVQIPHDVLPSELLALPSNIRTEIIKQYILSLGGKGIFNPLSFGLNTAIEPQIKAAVGEYLNDSISDIENTYTIDESTIDAGTMQSIRDIRTGINYFKAGYIWLIIIIVVLIGLIFLINWKNIRGAMRALGIDLLIFGILDLAGVLLTRYVQPEKYVFENLDVSVAIQNWIHGLITDVTGIMLMFSIGVLIIGIGFIVGSFFIKRPEANA